MEVAEIGVVAGEVALCGGIYSNLQALRAFEDAAGGRTVICTGDIVAYCADPATCVARVRELGWPVVAGNCERQIAAGAGDCGCGFEDGSACDLLSGAWYAHARAAIGAEDRAWMAGLPDLLLFRAFGRRWAVLHGGATAINRFLWPVSPEAAFAEEIAAVWDMVGPVDGVIAGHSGFPFRRRVDGVDWVNAGAIGLPPNYGGPETHFAVLGENGVTFRVLAYDARGARDAMRAAGLTQGYDRTLETGWWPSEEILPPELRRP